MIRVENLTKRFGGLTAVDGLTYEFPEGQVTGIIGPNGAGKTTLFNLICGLLTPDAGSVYLDGNEITDLPAHERVDAGLARSFQITNVFEGLSVLDNLTVVTQQQYSDSHLIQRTPETIESRSTAMDILNDIRLEEKIDNLGGELSHAQQRRLDIGITLATGAPVLLLDEPTAGMTPAEKGKTLDLLDRVKDGKTIILIEHDMKFINEIVDRVLVLHRGDVLSDGAPKEVRENKEVIEVYLGE